MYGASLNGQNKMLQGINMLWNSLSVLIEILSTPLPMANNATNQRIRDEHLQILKQITSRPMLAALLMNNKPGTPSIEDIAEKYPIVMECSDAGNTCNSKSFDTFIDRHFFKCYTYKPSERPRHGLVNGVTFTFLSGGGILGNLTFKPNSPFDGTSMPGYDNPFWPAYAIDGIHLVIHDRGINIKIFL